MKLFVLPIIALVSLAACVEPQTTTVSADDVAFCEATRDLSGVIMLGRQTGIAEAELRNLDSIRSVSPGLRDLVDLMITESYRRGRGATEADQRAMIGAFAQTNYDACISAVTA